MPFVPELSLSGFAMKGSATKDRMNVSEWGGRVFDGNVSGSARVRWGATWGAEGEVRVRSMNVAVFAPALVSEGKVEGRGVYSMSGPSPAKLYESARLEGNFRIEKGVLGSVDMMRALQSGGGQTSGRTIFAELTAQGVYDKGAVQLRNIAIAAGTLHATAALDIDALGTLAGRINGEVKTATMTMRAALNISGKRQEPVVRK